MSTNLYNNFSSLDWLRAHLAADTVATAEGKKYRDRRCKGLKQRHLFVVACCVCFVIFCLGCPEQLIKLFANRQARQDTGQEVSIYRQNRTDCLSSFQYFTPPISILLDAEHKYRIKYFNFSNSDVFWRQNYN